MQKTTSRFSSLNKCFGVLLVFSSITSLFYVASLFNQDSSGQLPGGDFRPKQEFIQVFEQGRPYPSTRDITVQLMTPFFQKWDVIDGMVKRYNKEKCPWNCVYQRQNSSTHSDVLVYHANDLDEKHFPTTRDPDQIWLLHSGESPWKIATNMAHYNNYFNWTYFVRFDSDVVWRYGNIVQKPSTNGRLVEKGLMPRARTAYWMASNCGTFTFRDTYVEELRKYVEVDVFGKCLPDAQACNSSDPRCSGDRYTFYLAFENAICRNYITEKFWRSLKEGVIPVVMGDSSSYLHVAPPNSYIDVSYFTSPQHLGEYLLKVQNNITLYRSYFQWKQAYTIQNSWSCDLCEALHKWDGRRQVYTDL